MSDPIPPSGEQYEITHGAQTATVVSVGGGLRTYTVDGEPVLDGYDVDAMCDGARGQTLVPWPNRVRDGKWHWQGEERQLALTEPEQHNAIHGLVRWMSWERVEHSADTVSLRCRSFPQPGYPWPIDVETHYRVDDAGVTVTTEITNLGQSPAPVAAGAHPYLTVGTPRIDAAELHLPADSWLPTGPQQIPTGRKPVDGTPYDFRVPRVIGDTEIDYAFADLHRGEDDMFRLRLADPRGRAVTFWLDGSYAYIEVFTGDALPDPARRRQGLGVEPMSAPPNALATGESLVVLEPGGRWRGQWGITPG